MNNELSLRSTKKKRKKFTEIEVVIKEANSLYIKNDLDQCIAKARDVLSKAPKCDRAYFLLGLVFEEKKDIIKAYNFYMIAAQLMKNNYELWYKLYTLANSLNLFSDKLYFIQIIQRYKNSRSLVVEKMELFKMLKNKYKALECKVELFEFDGIDFEIFDKIRSETKHKLRTSVLALLLIRYYKKNMKACGFDYLMNCIRLQYESGYLIGTKNTLEKYIFPNISFIPNDIRIIYIVCCLANTKTTNEDSLFKSKYRENEIETENNTIKNELNYENISEKIFTATKSILSDLNSDDVCSKTLRLDTFDRRLPLKPEQEDDPTKDVYVKYSDLDIFLVDDNFWDAFKEDKEIKPLVEVLIELNMLEYATKLINKLLDTTPTLQEFCNYNLGEIACVLKDKNMASMYFEKVLKINPDNISVKSKLYDIYIEMGNKDMSSHYKTVSSLINYVDDTNNKEKKNYRFSFEDCQRFRDLYFEGRKMFGIDFKSHIKTTKPLVEDFLKNEFIFIQNPKFKNFVTYDDRKIESLKAYNFSPDDVDKKTKIIDNLRYLSLHGLDSDEWFFVLFEYIVSKIENKNYLEASFLLRRCLAAHLFVKRKDLFVIFFFLSVKHSLYNNDFTLLTHSFKRLIAIFENYNLSHYFFYLENFFLEPHLKHSCGKFMRNIRRFYFRSCIAKKSISIEDLTDEASDSSIDSVNGSCASMPVPEEFSKKSDVPLKYKLDPLCFLNTYLNKSIFSKTYKVLDKVKQPLSINEEVLRCIIYIMACKSRNNSEKNSIIKKALENLNKLRNRVKGEQNHTILYNIGKVYDMLGYVGYAERYYKEAYQTQNRELKRMIQFNLILIYKKSGNSVLRDKYYEEDV